MRAIVTVIGKDRVGIIADVCSLLAKNGVNVLDISQTVMQEYFTMIMLVEKPDEGLAFDELSRLLDDAGREQGLSIRIQREEIFDAMHRI
ncbi:MAG TPA: ACT domain-containing protein [Clostridiales bacterium]|jgi:ACT domain-containing protein|nr:ACT domain-containing protein [Clostridiales bacterium]